MSFGAKGEAFEADGMHFCRPRRRAYRYFVNWRGLGIGV
jgi:hypothetical protein